MAITINGDGLIDIGGTTTTQGRVRLAEDADNGSNYVEITAPASVAANRVITFPDANTTVVGTDAVQTLTNKTLTAPLINGGGADNFSLVTPTVNSPTITGTPVVEASLIVLGTAQAATATSVTFTGIPSWDKRVTLMLDQISTGGTSPFFIRLGTASGLDATNYTYVNHVIATGVASVDNLSAAGYANGFCLTLGTSYTFPGAAYAGQIVLSLVGSNTWIAAGQHSNSATSGELTYFITGRKALGAALEQLQIYTFNGTDTFDNGSFNIQYE